MAQKLIKLDEPNILFGHGQQLEDPRDGLTLFGPIENLKPYGITSGVIGTKEGLRKFKEYVDSIQTPVFNHNGETRPFFPGFEAVFGTKWTSDNLFFEEVTQSEIGAVLYHEDNHVRTYDAVTLFADRIINAVSNEDVNVDIWFVIIPEEIYSYCRPNSSLPKELVKARRTVKAKKFINAPSLFEDINQEVERYKYEAQFHNQLKARLLKHTVATQILRETTIDWRNHKNAFGGYIRDFSKIEGHLAWCISTGVFYKTGGRPWKLSDIRKGVCYIGLVYKKDERNKDPRNACCAAQMFLDSGDGVVFRGAVGPWYNRATEEYHLDEERAENLVAMVVETYKKKHGGQAPQELFIHARTRFNNKEWEGFKAGAPEGTNVVCITIKHVPMKIYRWEGDFPMLRGLAFPQGNRSGYLWTKGFVPRLGTSMAMEVPNPLFIKISKGETDIETVLEDILALTKLNYNACVFADGEPVTIKFANAVGEILTSCPLDEPVKPLAFKYYI